MQVSTNNIVAQLLQTSKAEIETRQQIAVTVAKKQLDAQRQTGQAINELIASAVKIGQASSSVDFHA